MKHFVCLIALTASALLAQADELATLIAKGDALDARLQNKQALGFYQAAEKTDPNNVDLLCRIAREYGLMMCDTADEAEKQKLAEKGLAYARKAAALDPKSPNAHLCVAVCSGRLAPLLDSKMKLAYSKEVKEHADKALALDPNNDLTYYVLGAWNYEVASLGAMTRTLAKLIYGEVPAASYQQSLDYLRKAVKLNPKRVGSHFSLGRTLAAMGRKEEARQELTLAVTMPTRDKDDPVQKQRAAQALKEL